jgi:hypothetical protein
VAKPDSIYPPKSKVRWLVRLGGCASAAALVCTILLALRAWRLGEVEVIYSLAVLWTVLPPIWFWFEFFFLYQTSGEKDGFEAFKYGQQVSIAIWAAVTLSLVAIATSEHFKGKVDVCSCGTSSEGSSTEGPGQDFAPIEIQ